MQGAERYRFRRAEESLRPGGTNHLFPLLESVLLQVRGTSGIRLSAKDPLPPIASREEVEATRNHVLETFYPISPTIDLQECHVYDLKDDTGGKQSLLFLLCGDEGNDFAEGRRIF